MNILVSLRAVRDAASFTVNRRAQKIFIHHDDCPINPSDRNALEAALRLAGEAHTVIAAALDPAKPGAKASPADDGLRQALAAGAKRAVRVRGPALKAADGWVTANVLRGLADHLGGADLILLGADVLDADLGQVGPRLAAALDWPFVEAAHALDLSGEAILARVHRPDGFHQLQASLPAVVSVAAHSNQPRYAPGARIINVYADPQAVEALDVADLGLAEADLTPRGERRGESFPPERELGKRLEGAPDELAAQVASLLRQL